MPKTDFLLIGLIRHRSSMEHRDEEGWRCHSDMHETCNSGRLKRLINSNRCLWKRWHIFFFLSFIGGKSDSRFAVCQFAVSHHTVTAQRAGCACPAWKVKARQRPTLDDLGGSSEIESHFINNFSQFLCCVLKGSFPPHSLLDSDSNCSPTNPQPKTSPWSFSVFMLFMVVAFHPCGCRSVALIIWS